MRLRRSQWRGPGVPVGLPVCMDLGSLGVPDLRQCGACGDLYSLGRCHQEVEGAAEIQRSRQ